MKERIDILLVERRFVESRTKAQWLIRNGCVLVNGIEIKKPGKRVDNSLPIILKSDFPYVSRGGIKLEKALKDFSISVEDKVCADIGASVGGFTDCLLKNGAFRVYAIDVSEDLLHPSLKCEKMKDRVIALLGVDARYLKELQEKVDICTIDVTFSSLRLILPNVKNFIKNEGDIIALIKPLFETDFKKQQKLQIIHDSKELQKILTDLINWCEQNAFFPYGLIKSPLLGKGGAIEFILHLRIDQPNIIIDYKSLINELV
jgi:23S rRNA (cytidine1920-2'-O)/16S rRNA (cytidine1409-2'-O)-methyltransferase